MLNLMIHLLVRALTAFVMIVMAWTIEKSLGMTLAMLYFCDILITVNRSLNENSQNPKGN